MKSAREEAVVEPSNWSEIETAVRERGELVGLVSHLLSADDGLRARALDILGTALRELLSGERKIAWASRGRPRRAIYDKRLTRDLQFHAAVRKLKSYDFVGEPPDADLNEVAEKASLIGIGIQPEMLRDAYHGRRRPLREARKMWVDPALKSQRIDLTPDDRLALLWTLANNLDRPQEEHLIPFWNLAKMRGLLVRIERGPKETKEETAARRDNHSPPKKQMFIVTPEFWDEHAKVRDSESDEVPDVTAQAVFEAARQAYNARALEKDDKAIFDARSGIYRSRRATSPSKVEVFYDAVTRLIHLITIDRDDIPADGFRLLADFCERRKLPKA